jgi:hypothetical protein
MYVISEIVDGDRTKEGLEEEKAGRDSAFIFMQGDSSVAIAHTVVWSRKTGPTVQNLESEEVRKDLENEIWVPKVYIHGASVPKAQFYLY